MLKKIEKFLLKKSSDLIGIDIGTESIKLVEIAMEKNQPVLKNYGIIELPDMTMEDGRIVDSEKLSFTINKLLSTTRTVSKNAVIAVGGRNTFAREFVFPKMTIAELGEAIRWDLAKYIPYNPGSFNFDFSIIGAGNTETEMKVLLVAAPLDYITTIINVIKSVGLTPFAIDIEPFALYRIFDDIQQAMVIDIGAALSQIIVFKNGSPTVIRNIPIGGYNFTRVIMEGINLDFNEAENIKQTKLILSQSYVDDQYSKVKSEMELIVSELIQNINRTAEYYQQQNQNSKIDKIFITGGGANLNSIAQILTERLEIPAILYDPLSRLKIPSAFDRIHLRKVAPQLATAIGLALRGGGE
jgi:type IV pilus assembly protein PilM